MNAEAIKSRIDLVNYVSRYTKLERSGRDFLGLCPFHSEKTPSFRVHNGRWRCFGACNSSGDLIDFVMQMEHLDFLEAYRKLAEEIGLEVEDNHSALYQVTESVSAYYHEYLMDKTAGAAVRYYLEQRGFDEKEMRKWRIGYAPGQAAKTHLLRFSEDHLRQCGIVLDGKYGKYDPMEKRIVIPIQDKGKIAGFAGRSLVDNGRAKYVNTTDTVLFRKHQIAFGLDMARKAIDACDCAVLVEGYFDVIGAHKQGVENVVAVMSASPSIEQIRRIHCSNFALSFDGDLAGRQSTERSTELLLSQGKRVQIVRLPDGKDVDEVDFKQYVDQAVSEEEYLLEFSKSEPERVLQILNEASDNALKTRLTSQIAASTGIPVEGLKILPSKNLHFQLPQRNYDLESAVAGELQKRPERLAEIQDFFAPIRPFSSLDFQNADCKEVFKVVQYGNTNFHTQINDDCQNIVAAARSLRMRRLASECALGSAEAISEKAILLARHSV
jgi:DNA primase catalytic core